jgi:hypothetical protein
LPALIISSLLVLLKRVNCVIDIDNSSTRLVSLFDEPSQRSLVEECYVHPTEFTSGNLSRRELGRSSRGFTAIAGSLAARPRR